MNRVSLLFATGLLTIAGLASTDATAQSYLDRNASAAQIKRALQGTRSISRRSAPQVSAPSHQRAAAGHGGSRSGSAARSVQSAAAAATVAATPLPASAGDLDEGPASFRIQFALGSAELRREAIPLLDRLGEALTSDELRDWAFVVEGHTDASGDEQFNQELSLRRAEAVRDYQVAKHGIDPARLPVRGYGESRPYDPSRPAAAINRRVTFSAPETAAEAAAGAVATSADTPAEDTMEVESTIIETGPTPAAAPEPVRPTPNPAAAPAPDAGAAAPADEGASPTSAS